MKLLTILLSVAVSGCGLFHSLPRKEEPKPKIDVVKRALHNTVALQDGRGDTFCSGVAADGIVFTAHHCIEPLEEGATVRYMGTNFRFVVALDWPAKDLSALQLVGKRLRDTVPMAHQGPVWGQKVVWTGHPLGAQLIMGQGIVGNPKSLQGRMAVYGQFIPGNSGGPVFDETGKLLGLISATMAIPGVPFPQFLPVGYAVHWDDLKEALSAL